MYFKMLNKCHHEIRLVDARIRRSGQFEVFSGGLVLRFAKEADLTLATDFDKDGSVGFTDFLAFASHFGSSRGNAKYDAIYDLDNDGQIGFSDYLRFAGDFGTG